MASSAADPWGQNLESFFHGARERRLGAEQERQRLEAEYADKLLAAHVRGVKQGAATERARIRLLALVEATRDPTTLSSVERSVRSDALRDLAALLEDR